MKYINLFDTQAAYDAAEKYYPNVSYIEATDEVVYQENDPGPDYSKEYFTFEALQNGTFTLTVPAAVDSTNMTSISYSVDDGDNWVTTTIDNTAQTITTPTINAGDKVLWKGEGISLTKYNDWAASYFSSTGNFNVEGNIMSMIYGDNFQNQTTFPNNSNNTFSDLFKNCTKLINANNLILPATTLINGCYCSLFRGCTSLVTIPELPATTLANYCYGETNNRGMFSGCTSLTSVPSDLLPVTTMAIGCYQGMFAGCTSLTTAPELPATTLANYCYQYMFGGCTSLTTAPELPSTTLAAGCYAAMFYGCTALTTAPELPSTTLAAGCYNVMFSGCTNLNSIKMLATDISATNCLNQWVNNVAATGTFTKAAEMTTLPTGISGIPSGWTVVDA